MATKKEILKHKQEWIDALNDTINEYMLCIEEDSIYNNDSATCKLCILDCKFGDTCDQCIHLSPFSQGKSCGKQLSYNNMAVNKDSKSYKVRIRFLKNVLKRLEKAS